MVCRLFGGDRREQELLLTHRGIGVVQIEGSRLLMWSDSRGGGVKESRTGFAGYCQVDDLWSHRMVLSSQPVGIQLDVTLITLGPGNDIGLAERNRVAEGDVVLDALGVPLHPVLIFRGMAQVAHGEMAVGRTVPHVRGGMEVGHRG